MKRHVAWHLLPTASLIVLLNACASSSPSGSSNGDNVSVPTVEAEVTRAAGESGAEANGEASPGEVTFETADGVTLSGTLFGTGDSAIVLSHMYATDQSSWQPFAQVAANRGYLALTYDFRGYGASEGRPDIPAIDRDVRAAYDFVRQQGAQRVVLIGADIGGTASIKVAASLGGELTGLVVLSSPQSFQGLEVTAPDLAALNMPSLWLSARTDMVTRELEDMFNAAAGPDKSMWVFEGSGTHGTFIFGAPLDAADLEQRLLDFLAAVAPVGG